MTEVASVLAPGRTAAGVALRPVTADDRDFLLSVYESTRADELDLVDWPAVAKRSFVELQFVAQDVHYRAHYPRASFGLVVVHEQRCGRLTVDRRPTEIRIVDIALLSAHRGAGVGTLLLRRLIDEAAGSRRKVSIHVEFHNPARRLYTRLGFVPVAEHGTHLLMEQTPGGSMTDTPAAFAAKT